MSATANPNFELEHQALQNLKRVHRICLWLQGMQVFAAACAVGLLERSEHLGMYGAMLYLFSAVFAHIVAYYVLMSIGRNVRDAYYSDPHRPQEWLVFATAKLSGKIFPFIFVHALLLFTLVGMAAAHGLAGRPVPYLIVIGWTAAAVGVACTVRIAAAFRENNEYLTCFVRGAGFSSRVTELSEDH